LANLIISQSRPANRLDLGEFAAVDLERARRRNMTDPDRNNLFKKAGQALAVGRVGEPGDLAETYLYLMRERFSTEAMIIVDGGGTLI
jgi:hypothetical protein